MDLEQNKFIKNLRPNVKTFDTNEELFIYDIEEDTSQPGNRGGHQFFLFCIGKKGHSVTLIVRDCPVLLEVILPDHSMSKDDVMDICNSCHIDTQDILSLEFKKKQTYKGFRLSVDGGVDNVHVLEMTFNFRNDMYRVLNKLKDMWGGMLAGEGTSSVLKFSIRTGIKPSTWITVVKMCETFRSITTNQLEFEVSHECLKMKEDDKTLPKFVVAGFDLETDNPEGFCKDGSQSIVCISTHVYVDDGKSHTFTHYLENPHNIDEETKNDYVRQVKKHKSIPETSIYPKGTIFSYKDEYKMLQDWKDFLVEHVNADIITGYNIYGYDWLYVCERMYNLAKKRKKTVPHTLKFEAMDQYKTYGQHVMRQFFSFSKLKSRFTGLVIKKSNSVAMGDNILYNTPTAGRIQIDMLQKIKNHQTQKLVDMKLQTVSAHFLKEGKEDLKAADLFKIWRLGKKDTIIAYCETDAELPVRLMYAKSLQILLEGVALSQLTITPLNNILNNGKTKCIQNMTIWYATKNNLALNIDSQDIEEKGSYAGAKVLDPTPGRHDTVLVYDFNSLYPSIMRWGNFCPSSLVRDVSNPNLDYVNKFDITNPITGEVMMSKYFVKKSVYEGLLPKLLYYLITERKKDQKKMEELKEYCRTHDTDLSMTNFDSLNAAQLAKKLIANSVYGVCAYPKYMYGAKEVSESTTSMGRQFIQMAKNHMEKNYKHLNAECIYGDTDSVFIRIDGKGKNLLDVLEIAQDMEKECQTIFPPGIVLGFEKIIKNLILSNRKKCYFGTTYEPNPKYELPKIIQPNEIDDVCEKKFFEGIISTGFSTKKKGVPKIVTNLVKDVISKLLKGESEDIVANHIQEYINDIDKSVNIDDFIKINRVKGSYKSENVPHQMVVVRKLKHRKMDAPESGSYVPFVILTPQSAFKLSKLYTKRHYENYESACAEDPQYLKELEKGQYKINFGKYIHMILSEIERIYHIFPEQLYHIKNVAMRKGLHTKAKETYNMIDIFGGKIENFLPNLKRDSVKKSHAANQDIKQMLMKRKKSCDGHFKTKKHKIQ